jgi:drug/metabolite transporter (DMT)-like permease
VIESLRSPVLRTWAGVVLISFSGIYVRLADVEPIRSAFLRCAYALPMLWAVVWWQRRKKTGKPMRILLPRAVLAGTMLGLDLIVWHMSIGIIGAGLATVFPCLQVVFVAVVGVMLFGERPGRAFWLAVVPVLVGVWLLGSSAKALQVGTSSVFGVGLGVLTAFFYTAYLIWLRIARLQTPTAGAFEIMASATLGATLMMAVFAVPMGLAAPAGRWPADGWLLALALSSQVLGWAFLASSIHRIPAALTAVALLLQPVLAMVWGVVLLHEPIGMSQAAGAFTVLFGVAIAHHAVSRGAVKAIPPGGLPSA